MKASQLASDGDNSSATDDILFLMHERRKKDSIVGKKFYDKTEYEILLSINIFDLLLKLKNQCNCFWKLLLSYKINKFTSKLLLKRNNCAVVPNDRLRKIKVKVYMMTHIKGEINLFNFNRMIGSNPSNIPTSTEIILFNDLFLKKK